MTKHETEVEPVTRYAVTADTGNAGDDGLQVMGVVVGVFEAIAPRIACEMAEARWADVREDLSAFMAHEPSWSRECDACERCELETRPGDGHYSLPIGGGGVLTLCARCADVRPCEDCDGEGYFLHSDRPETCPTCGGTGTATPCACGAEYVPSAVPVTHESGDMDEAIHTPARCARYTPRDGWEEWRAPNAEEMADDPEDAGERWRSTGDGMPEWCEEYADDAHEDDEDDDEDRCRACGQVEAGCAGECSDCFPEGGE